MTRWPLIGISAFVVLAGAALIWYEAGAPQRELERERKLTRQAGIPLSIADAQAMNLIEPGSAAQDVYDELLAKKTKTDLARAYSLAGNFPSRYAKASGPELKSLVEQFRSASHGSEELLALARRATAFDVWHPDSEWGDTGSLERQLHLVSLAELLCAKAACEVEAGNTWRGVIDLEVARRIGFHLVHQPYFMSQATGSLILSVVYEAATGIARKHAADKNLLADLLTIAERRPPLPNPFLFFKIYMAGSYVDWLQRVYPPEVENNRPMAANPAAWTAAEVAWLRAIRQVHRDLEGTSKSFVDIARALQSRKDLVDPWVRALFPEKETIEQEASDLGAPFGGAAHVLEGVTTMQGQPEDRRKALLALLASLSKSRSGGGTKASSG